MEKKEDLTKCGLTELIELEKIARIVCMKYESSSKSYDGTIINNGEYSLFNLYNTFRNDVINEMEKRIKDKMGKK